MTPTGPMADLLDRLRAAATEGEAVTVRDVLGHLDSSSFASFILVTALALVTPLSGIPTFPTIGAVIIALVTVQWALGRRHLWLPDFLMRRAIPSNRLLSGVDWLDRPARWIDRVTDPRLSVLTRPPLSALPLVLILCNVAVWPVLELLPLVTTTSAVMVALFAFGLMMRDGLFVLAGYVWAAIIGAAVLWML